MTDTDTRDTQRLLAGPFIAVRNRAFGSSSVHFGPFATLEELYAWSDKHQLSVAVINLTDPNSDPTEWWG